MVQVVDQPVGVGGDAQHPLLEGALDHRVVAAFAAAFVGDFFVGQHGAQTRAPVHLDVGEVGQAVFVEQAQLLIGGELVPFAQADGRAGEGFDVLLVAGPVQLGVGGQQIVFAFQLLDQVRDGHGFALNRVVVAVVKLQEDPLGPLHKARVGGGQAAVPVVAEAQLLELADHVFDVAFGGDPRVHVVLDGVLLGGQAKGVEAHGVQHVEPAHAAVAAGDVGGDEAQGVAHVQPHPAGIGEHVQHVVLGLGGVEVRVAGVGGAEGFGVGPAGLPLGFDGLEVVFHGAASLSGVAGRALRLAPTGRGAPIAERVPGWTGVFCGP